MGHSVTIYSTSLCNLNCSYCFISKNKALIELDKYFEEASRGNYYIDLINEYIDDVNDVESLEIWGGEPTLHLERANNLIRQLCEKSRNFKYIFFSSNYCSENFFDSFSNFVEFLGTISDRDFILTSQISIDGPECITDKYRGIGVTKKVIENFDKVLSINIPNNVKIKFSCKPTLSLETAKMLLDKNFIIDYFKFFEDNFLSKINDCNNDKFIHMNPPVPNLACPDEYTTEDGKLFANIEKSLYEVELENREDKIFKYYKIIRMFKRKYKKIPEKGYIFRGGFCGSGRFMIGLLPFGKACGCHRDFTDFLENYRKEAQKDKYQKIIRTDNINPNSLNSKVLIFNNKYDAIRHEKRMSSFYDNPTTTMITSSMAMIKVLAMTNQIDSKYLDEEECRKAAYKLMHTSAVCIENNISLNGNCSVIPISDYRLFLNGALDYIDKE